MNQQPLIVDATPNHESRRLYRSRTERQVAGVAGGLAEYLGIDPTIIRIVWLVSILFGGAGALAYLVMAMVLPEETAEHAANKPVAAQRGAALRAWAGREGNRGLLWGGILIAAGILFLLSNFDVIPLRAVWRTFWQLFWPAVLIGMGIILLLGISGRGVDWKGVIRGDRSLARSRRNRMIGGVCAGLADYLGLDASLVRIVWVIASLSTVGLGVMLYILALIVMPEAPEVEASAPPVQTTPGTSI